MSKKNQSSLVGAATASGVKPSKPLALRPVRKRRLRPDFCIGVQKSAGEVVALLLAAHSQDRADALEVLATVAAGFGITGEEIAHYQRRDEVGGLPDEPEMAAWHQEKQRLERAAKAKWAR